MTDLTKYDNMTLGDAQEIYMHIEKNNILSTYTFPDKPSKDGYYRIYVTDTTKKAGRKQLTAKSLDELKDKVYDYEKGVQGNARKTFAQVFEFTLDEKLKYIKDPEKKLSRQNTVGKNRSDFNRFFADTAFAGKYIDAITKSDIEDIVYFNLNRFDIRGKAFSAIKGILRSTFHYAYCHYWIEEDVFLRADFRKFEGMLAKDVDIEKRVHSDEELSKILDELHTQQKKKPSYIPAYALEMQIICGCRRGEIPPLRRSDIKDSYIEFSREQITVKKFNGVPEHCEIVEHTKTYKDRYFPRSNALNEFLERLIRVLDKYYPDTDYLFPFDNDNGVISNNIVYNYYHRVCKKLNIKLSREEMKGTHSFRRNAITDVVNASGGNVILASSLFGNSPEVAKKNYYTGINMDEALEVLNKRKFS